MCLACTPGDAMSKAQPMPNDMLPTCHQIDLREAPRLPCVGKQVLRAIVEAEFHPMEFAARDLSVKGVGLLGDQSIAPGTLIAILWEFGNPLAWRTVRATVVHLTPRRAGGWIVGCVFAQPLAQA